MLFAITSKVLKKRKNFKINRESGRLKKNRQKTGRSSALSEYLAGLGIRIRRAFFSGFGEKKSFFYLLEMHTLAAASRSRLFETPYYMRSHGSALNLSLRQT